MDIANSDVGHLGYYGSEAYGLTWKVSGSRADRFDLVDVLGNVTDSKIHHNYFGLYMYGAYGMQVAGNEVYDNFKYGIDPHDDSDYLVIENNNVHDNGNHGIIGSKRCDNLVIRNNISRNNVGHGIMLHRGVDDAVVEGNQSLNNTDTGIAVMDSYRSVIRGNTVLGNKNGIRFSVGAADNQVLSNVVGSTTGYGFYFYKGSDEPSPGDDGRPKRNYFEGNTVRDNVGYAINLGDGDDNTFVNNNFSTNNSSTFLFNRGRNNRLSGNTFAATAVISTKGTSSIASSTHFSNQPSIRVQLDSYSSAIFAAAAGQVFDLTIAGKVTTVEPEGSTLTLRQANIGSSAVLVTTRNR